MCLTALAHWSDPFLSRAIYYPPPPSHTHTLTRLECKSPMCYPHHQRGFCWLFSDTIVCFQSPSIMFSRSVRVWGRFSLMKRLLDKFHNFLEIVLKVEAVRGWGGGGGTSFLTSFCSVLEILQCVCGIVYQLFLPRPIPIADNIYWDVKNFKLT